MTKKEWVDRRTVFEEHIFDAKKDLKNVKFKLMVADNKNEKQFFEEAIVRLENVIAEYNTKLMELQNEYLNKKED